MGRKKRKAPGWLVWGLKKRKGKGYVRGRKGRQLGVAHRLKANAEKLARQFRARGFVASVQETLRRPKRD